jgi:hypothetical protein
MEKQIEEKNVEVFGTKEVSIKEFMSAKDKSLVLLSDYDLAKKNLDALRLKHEKRVDELVSIEKLSADEYKELTSIRGILREPRYLMQNLKKDNASVLASYSKNDKSKWDGLIVINEPIEDKASDKIKIEDDRKKNEKLEAEQAEEKRIKTIKDKIELFESESYKIIQSTKLEDISISKSMLDAFVNVEFDYEEYDILFEQARSRVQASWDEKCADIQEKEEQRLENERLEKENAEAKRLSDLQASRLKEILPYVAFGEAVDLTNLSELEEIDYSKILASKKALFDADAEKKQKEQEELEAKAKADKEKIFEIRKNRLVEIGVFEVNNKNQLSKLDFIFSDNSKIFSKSAETVFEADAIDFEIIITDAKLAIEKAKSDAKEEVFKKRKETLESVSLLKEEITHIHSEKIGSVSFEDFYNCEIVSDEDFNFVMDEVRASRKAYDELLANEDAERLKKENKARIAKYAKDKKELTAFVKSLEFRNAVPELENEDMQVVLDNILQELENTRGHLLTNINLF